MDENKVADFNAFRERRLALAKKEAATASLKTEKRNRVHFHDFLLMFVVAAIFDGLQFLLSGIPVLGWLLSAVVGGYAWLTFWFWTSQKGWGDMDRGKKILDSKVVMKFLIKWMPIIEIIPVADILPLWMVRVVLQLLLLKAEDVVYNTSGGKLDLEKIGALYTRNSNNINPKDIRTSVNPKIVDTRMQRETKGSLASTPGVTLTHVGDPQEIRRLREDTPLGPSFTRSGADPEVQKDVERKFPVVAGHKYDPVSEDRMEAKMLTPNRAIEQSQKTKESHLASKGEGYRKRYEETEEKIKQEYIDLHQEAGDDFSWLGNGGLLKNPLEKGTPKKRGENNNLGKAA